MLYPPFKFISLFILYRVYAVRGSMNLLPDAGETLDNEDTAIKNCVNAYNKTLDCTKDIRLVRHYYQYEWTSDKLAALCTPQCSNAIDSWSAEVKESCDEHDPPFFIGENSYKGSVDTDKLRYGLDMVCTKSTDEESSGNWCQHEAEKWHTYLEPSFKNALHGLEQREEGDQTFDLPSHETTGLLSAYPKSVLCSSCFFDRLGIQATTHSSNWSPALANDYAALGKMCSKSNKSAIKPARKTIPRPTGIFSLLSQTWSTGAVQEASTVPAEWISCEDTARVTFSDTDTPLSLSNNLIVSTAELLHINGIPLTGANILIPWKKLAKNKYRACTPLNCEILRVDKGESCEDVIRAAGTTAELFFSWNPYLIGNCASGLAELQNVCVGPPGGRYKLPNPVFDENPYMKLNLFSDMEN
ncbi:hypothetical protein TWF102_007031 [Orbilia oligospora]|uniref:LysM domain-containing protein n=1 Tax=Orbilia oligospora TaxID=2813651 RepID=A0A7C8NMC0_ORBOL|nr:hypothetical protein TWF102_007031 [Orbilia oligospora]